MGLVYKQIKSLKGWHIEWIFFSPWRGHYYQARGTTKETWRDGVVLGPKGFNQNLKKKSLREPSLLCWTRSKYVSSYKGSRQHHTTALRYTSATHRTTSRPKNMRTTPTNARHNTTPHNHSSLCWCRCCTALSPTTLCCNDDSALRQR